MNQLNRRLAELERRRPPRPAAPETLEEIDARIRAELVAIYGEADVAAAEAVTRKQVPSS